MNLIKKITLTIFVTFLALGIFLLFYLARHESYPVSQLKGDLIVSFLIGVNTAFVIPIIQDKVDRFVLERRE